MIGPGQQGNCVDGGIMPIRPGASVGTHTSGGCLEGGGQGMSGCAPQWPTQCVELGPNMPTGIGVFTISWDGGRGHPPCAGLGQWSRNASGARRKLPRGLRPAPVCLELGQWPTNCGPQGSGDCLTLPGSGNAGDGAGQLPDHVVGQGMVGCVEPR
jgi:hypothetical protein